MYEDIWGEVKERQLLQVTLGLRKILLRSKQLDMARNLDKYTSQYILLMRDGQDKVNRLNIEVDSLSEWVGRAI
jgi:hypothetical protein